MQAIDLSEGMLKLFQRRCDKPSPSENLQFVLCSDMNTTKPPYYQNVRALEDLKN